MRRMTATSARGATIRIFLVDGTPQGLRLVERMGWTGSCLAFARADFPAARTRPEMTRTGVYLLLGPDPEGKRTQRTYVGEADEVRTRLDTHQKEKDFWTHAYVLTTKDDSLNKAHVRYLEARLLGLARTADNAALDNGTAPPVTRLSEPEVADMESYLDTALMLLPLVGVNVFDVIEDPVPTDAPAPSNAPAGVSGTGPVTATRDVPGKFVLRTQLTYAEGRDDSRGFLVYDGALGRRESKVMIAGYKQLRDRLTREGVLVPEGVDQLRLTKNFVFESPSAAASVLAGGSKNGRTEWKDAGGKTLKEVQEQSAA